MIYHFDQDSSPSSLQADVCLVGAGAAGIILALELSRAGLSVALIESGASTPKEADQQLNHGQLAPDVRYKGLESGRARSLGGAMKLWYGQCIRYEPIDFEPRPWVPHSGWPISLDSLTPFYERAEDYFAIRDLPYHDNIYDRFGLQKLPFDQSLCRMHFTIYTPKIDTGSLHEKELQEAKNISLLLRANVVEITSNETATQATGVRIRSLDGKEGVVHAKAVVLCGGGIENARLLLLSNRIKPSGLGNEHDLVGRFLQDHPNGQTATLNTSQPALIGELFSLLYEPPLRFFPKMELSPELQTAEKVLNCNGHFVFEYPEQSGIAAGKAIYRSLRRGERPPELFKNIARILGDLPEAIKAAKRFFLHGKSPLGTPGRIRFQCYLEQQPDPDSRVQLADTRDALGLPQAKISWKLHDLERRTLKTMTNAVSAQISHLGLGELIADAWLDDPNADWKANLGDAFHPIGTTKMGASSETGVVDTNCEVFGVAGLYVAGSSVFPTSGYANPTLTIVALAYRLADHLASTLR